MLWIGIVLAIIALDRIAKILVIANIDFYTTITVIKKFCYLIHTENAGAAWGILPNGRYFFISITIMVSVVLVYYICKSESRLLKTALSFILGGAAGNFIDRLARGRVTDFLQIYLGSYDLPTGNIADLFIVAGTLLLAYYLLFKYKDARAKKDREEGKLERLGDGYGRDKTGC